MRITKNTFAVIALVIVVATASTLPFASKFFAGDFSGRSGKNSESKENKPTPKMWWGCIKPVPWSGKSEETKETEASSEEKPTVNTDGIMGNIGNNSRGGTIKETSRQSGTVDIPDKEIPGSVKKKPGSKETESKYWNWEPPECPEGYQVGYNKIHDTCKAFLLRVNNGSINLSNPEVAKKYQDYIVICRNQLSWIDWMDMLKNPIKESECQELKKLNSKLWKMTNTTAEAEAKGIDFSLLSKKLNQCNFVFGEKYNAGPDKG